MRSDEQENEARAEFPQRIKNLLEMGRLKVQPASHAQVIALWQKAVQCGRDAELKGLSIDGALRLAYDAGHLAALALLTAHGLRTGSGQGHHEIAFAAASALSDELLQELVSNSEEIRGLRKASMYDPVIAGPGDRDHALIWVRRTLPAIQKALIATRPDLATQLQPLDP